MFQFNDMTSTTYRHRCHTIHDGDLRDHIEWRLLEVHHSIENVRVAPRLLINSWRTQMRVIPECPSLVSHLEIIKERIFCDRTLCNKRHAIIPSWTVFVGRSRASAFRDARKKNDYTYNACTARSFSSSVTGIWKRLPLKPRITGPGKVPPASTVLNGVHEKVQEKRRVKQRTIYWSHRGWSLYSQQSNRLRWRSSKAKPGILKGYTGDG